MKYNKGNGRKRELLKSMSKENKTYSLYRTDKEFELDIYNKETQELTTKVIEVNSFKDLYKMLQEWK